MSAAMDAAATSSVSDARADQKFSAGSLSEPRSIVQSLTTKFHAATDVSFIHKIDEAFSRVQNSRAQHLAISRDNLNQWMKKVEGAKWEAQRPADRSEEAHAERMAAVDRERYVLSKAIDDLEMSIQREEAALAQFDQRSAAVAAHTRSIAEEQNTLSSDRIRTLVFRSEMGISWALNGLDAASTISDDGSLDLVGKSLKCRVVSPGLNDVFTLTYPAKASAKECADATFDETKKLWTMIPPQ